MKQIIDKTDNQPIIPIAVQPKLDPDGGLVENEQGLGVKKATTEQYGVVKYRIFQGKDITPVTVQPNEFVSIDFNDIEFNADKEAFITRYFGKCYVYDYLANEGHLRVSVCNPTNTALTISKVWFTLISI